MRERVLIADDHPIVRDAIVAAVRSSWPDCTVDEADSVSQAEAAVRAHKPALCVIDLMLPDAQGFSGVLLLQKVAPEAKMVVLSAREDADAISNARTLGVHAYLTKATPLGQIAAALREVMAGERVFPASSAPAAPDTGENMRKRLESLSTAQLRVLLALADGRLNKQIAADMDVTEATVKAHLSAIFRKLGVTNRSQAILAARPILGLDR